jgi:hypothetical protein
VKVVINKCYGGFGLSEEAVRLARQLSDNPKWGDCVLQGESYADGKRNDFNFGGYSPEVARHDEILIRVVEQLGATANGRCAELKVVEIPDGTRYEVGEYDGIESIHETHQSWS